MKQVWLCLIKNLHITNNFQMNKIIKEIINSVPVIAFCGLITSIFLGFYNRIFRVDHLNFLIGILILVAFTYHSIFFKNY